MTFHNANLAFEHYYRWINATGIEFDGTKAVFNELIHLQHPLDNTIQSSARQWNLNYVKREWEWYLSGNRSVSEIKKFAPIWDKMHSGNGLVWSNYGFWWKIGDQLEYVISMLKEKPDTRRAIVVHYNPNLVKEFEFDTPCNLVLNFYILNGKLELSVMARSIDLWYGFCNDQWIFSVLMAKVAAAVNTKIGELHYFITNLHLYKEQFI